MSKNTQHAIIAAAFGCYFIFLIGIIWYFNHGSEESATQTDATTTNASDMSENDSSSEDSTEIEISESFADILENGLTVQYDGKVLMFPCMYSEILSEEDGWKVYGDGLYDSAVSFGKDGLGYEVFLYMPVEDTGDFDTLNSIGCSGMGISLLDGKGVSIDTAPMFTIAWITWDDSLEDVLTAFGEPGYINKIEGDDGGILYTYLLYQTVYEERTYTLEFVIETDVGVVSMNYYYTE